MDIWRDARALAKTCYSLSKESQEAGDFELSNALPKTSGSIMDNIAEGFGRGGNREFLQFLSIALASCNELKSQLYRFSDRPYVHRKIQNEFADLESLTNRINGFIIYLKKSPVKGYKFKEGTTDYES